MKVYHGIITVAVLLVVSKAAELGQVVMKPDVSEIFVRMGDTLSVGCSVLKDKANRNNVLRWVKPSDDTSESTNMEGGLFASTLTIKKVTKAHLGTYRCEYGASSKQFELVAPNEEVVSQNFTYKDPSATLSCKLVKSMMTVKKTEWLRNDTLISELEDKDRFTVDVENQTLTISEPTRKDATLYKLRFHFKEVASTYDCHVPYRAEPYVVKFEKSKNLIEGDSMELQCKVLGYPHAVVQWSKDGKPVNQTDDKHVVLSPLDGYKNARLVIKDIEFDDAGTYTCKAHSAWFNVSESKDLVVRVKDKLAALWPFLGIVGEVVILCVIIFIYERRRNKQAESEANNAQDLDGSTTDKKEGLRHRNTQSNNPTA